MALVRPADRRTTKPRRTQLNSDPSTNHQDQENRRHQRRGPPTPTIKNRPPDEPGINQPHPRKIEASYLRIIHREAA